MTGSDSAGMFGSARCADPGDSEQPDYLSYLLRLWRVSDGEAPTWRALLKSSQTGQQVGFGSVDALFDYLRREAGLESGKSELERA
jgi:hypothetical protein